LNKFSINSKNWCEQGLVILSVSDSAPKKEKKHFPQNPSTTNYIIVHESRSSTCTRFASNYYVIWLRFLLNLTEISVSGVRQIHIIIMKYVVTKTCRELLRSYHMRFLFLLFLYLPAVIVIHVLSSSNTLYTSLNYNFRGCIFLCRR